MARSRSPKLLAQRADREYFKKPHPHRTWRRRLSWGALIATGLAVAWAVLPSNRLVWSKGHVSPSHAFIEKECGACHGRGRGDEASPSATAGALRSADLIKLTRSTPGDGPITNAACSTCHRGPKHHEGQLDEPTCASCHQEHAEPRKVADTRCTACHASLRDPSGQIHVAAAITGFPQGHVEFRAVASGADPVRLRLNHDVHLWPGLRGPNGPDSLTCLSCHAPEPTGRGFAPIKYDTHCARCHLLAVDNDKRLSGTVVPHGDLARAEETVRAAYEKQTNPDLDSTGKESSVAIEALRTKTCGRCHAASVAPHPGAATAPIDAVRFTDRWMPRANFRHRSHRELGCGACHVQAEASRSSEDVLLPGKEICGRCHSSNHGMSSDCVDCHRYHPDEKDPLGPAVFAVP